MAVAITVLFWAFVATLGIGLTRRAALWAKGRSAAFNPLDLLHIPKRYFVDLHHVVARDPYIANTHIMVAGGAIAALVLVGINYGLALYWPMLNLAILIAAVIMSVGVAFVIARRLDPPARLSRGGWSRLPFLLGALAFGLILLGLSSSVPILSGVLALVMLALLIAGGAELALGIGTGGPMKHAVAGLLHLAFHTRPARFLGERSTGLKPLDLEAKDYGTETPSAFRWNQLLSFDACVQCGKCEAVCPAFAAGQPLNPKKLIQDLVVGLAGGTDAAYAGSPSPGLAVGDHHGGPFDPVLPNLIKPETLWSCTTCRACVEECPMLIEHVDAIVDLRRHRALTLGEAPGAAPKTLANLRETGTAGGYLASARYNWAVDLSVPVAAPGQPVEVLLIAGESAFDLRAQRTLRALVRLLKAAQVDFALFGEAEQDCGDLARRLGDEATFQGLAKANIAALSPLSFQKIVTADPHVLHSLKNEYRDFGGVYDVAHHTTYLAELSQSGRLKLGKSQETRRVTYHDPCYLGRYNGEFEAPRALLAQAGVVVHEMQRSKTRSRCCGGGGGAPLTDIPGERRIPDMRIGDARETHAGVIAVGCPNCAVMLEGVTGDRPDVLDVAELLASALEA